MPDAENKFWTDVAHQLNPGWNISAGHDADAARTMLASHDTCVYVVDTSTWWITAGSTSSSELLRAKRQLGQAKLKTGVVAGAAGMAILECGAKQLLPDHADSQLALTAAICAVTDSGTWTAVMDRMGNPAGHWIWLVYKLKTGEPLGRPLFAHNEKRGFMPMADLKESIGAALANDISNAASSVSKQIRAGGGAQFYKEMFEWYATVLAGVAR